MNFKRLNNNKLILLFKSLKVVQSSTIVRCRNCRSYINPFVHFLDNTKWRCNLCYLVNDCMIFSSHLLASLNHDFFLI